MSAVFVRFTCVPPVTRKLLVVVASPVGVEMVIGPVKALLGTTAVTELKDVLVGVVAVPPPNNTEVVFDKLVPVIVTTVLGGPMTGENPKMFGKMENELVLIMTPPGVVIMTGPGVAFVGTVATIWFGDALKL